MVKVHSIVIGTPPPRPPSVHTRRILLLVWLISVAAPWLLQLRGFVELAMRHKISDNLIPTASAVKIKHDVAVYCPAGGLHIAGTWWNIHPTHYHKSVDEADTRVLCHFIIPQYNIHGTYHIQESEARYESEYCAHSGYRMSYYFYHGSIGYYSFYEEGDGVYCDRESTGFLVSSSVGSSDINLAALANFEGASGYRVSYYFGCVNLLWLSYRAIILMRSLVSCSQYGHRLNTLRESISIPGAVVFIQHASRIVPHKANNWHRFALLYLLVEGLMTDLFLLIARDGYAAKLQYISLGYNISGLLSVLFEVVESMKLLRLSWELLIKRLFFNTELAFWGELLFSVVMQHYLTGLNRSSLRHAVLETRAASHYLWGLVGHAIIVLGQTASILTVRATVSLGIVVARFHGFRVLTAPCCVDSVMSYRSKITKITGYIYRDSRLCYTQDALKAHGLLKLTSVNGGELLVYHKIHWFPESHEDLAIVGKIWSGHVEPCEEAPCLGLLSLCDQMLGGCDESESDARAEEMMTASVV